MILNIRDEKVFVIEMIQKSEGGNTYKAFINAYWLDAKDSFGKRFYFDSFPILGFDLFKSFYSYDDPYSDVKQLLNKLHDSSIRYMSEHQNIIVFCSDVTRAKFDRLTKSV